MLAFPHRFRILCNACRIFFIPASYTGGISTETGGFDHAFKRKITQRICLDEPPNLLDRHLRSNQVSFVWCIDAVVAGTDCGRATNANVNFFGPGFPNHPDNFLRRSSAYYRIVDQDHATAFNEIADGIELNANSERPDRLPWFDKCAADVVIPHQSKTKTNVTLCRVTNRRGCSRIGYGNDNIGLRRSFDSQPLTHAMPRFVYRLPINE